MKFTFFTEKDRLEKLSELGDSLERLNQVVNWEQFRPFLTLALYKEPKKSLAGRPPYDIVMMFKILVLQRIYNLSDDQTEFQINDRMSFMRFLGLGLEHRVPDAKTIWLFRDKLAKANAIENLFETFTIQLEKAHLVTHTGTIIDATFVDAPRQRNTRDENMKIKKGEIPEEWQEEDKKNKLCQKDTDARWAKKGDELHYGYKNHVKADAESKLITDYTVTSASASDGDVDVIDELVNDMDMILYADSAYSGEKTLKAITKKGIEACVHEKGYRDHPLTDEQKQTNREKSRVRARIEHIFGFMTNSMRGIFVRSVGMLRAKFNIGMMNLVYNMFRAKVLLKNCPLARVG